MSQKPDCLLSGSALYREAKVISDDSQRGVLNKVFLLQRTLSEAYQTFKNLESSISTLHCFRTVNLRYLKTNTKTA